MLFCGAPCFHLKYGKYIYVENERAVETNKQINQPEADMKSSTFCSLNVLLQQFKAKNFIENCKYWTRLVYYYVISRNVTAVLNLLAYTNTTPSWWKASFSSISFKWKMVNKRSTQQTKNEKEDEQPNLQQKF